MFEIDAAILISGMLLLLGIVSSKLSARLGVPVLVLFLLVGILAGSEGIGGLEFENYAVAHAIGTLALTMILFDGGLSTTLTAVHTAWKPAVLLATWGVLLTAVITGIAASYILDISLGHGLLLGSIVGSTDASAVFAVLRTGGVNLRKRLAAVLEVESASNDPMAIFLTIGCIEVLLGNVQLGPGLLGLLASQMIIGGICGVVGGYLAGWVVNKIDLDAAGMYPVLISAFCLLTFGLAAELGGSGFLAVYLAGVILGNRPLVFQRGIRVFHDAIAWLSQIMMFVVLGLLCFPSRLLDVAGQALLICAVLILVARPVAVLLSIFPFRFSWKETAFISWVGLKGAVPITLATFPLMLATPEHSLEAPLLFDVVFFIVLISAVIQGTSLAPAARWLGLEGPQQPEPPVTLELNSLRHIHGEIADYTIGKDSRAAGKCVKDLALPDGAVIALIVRDDQIIPPQGRTPIYAGDHVILVSRPEIVPLINQVFGRDSEVRGLIPATLEFPLRATTKMSELAELYGVGIDGPAERTLGEVLASELGKAIPEMGDTIRQDRLMLRVIRVADDGTVELVGMSILPEQPASEEPPVTVV